jgi:hypothetical protein
MQWMQLCRKSELALYDDNGENRNDSFDMGLSPNVFRDRLLAVGVLLFLGSLLDRTPLL